MFLTAGDFWIFLCFYELKFYLVFSSISIEIFQMKYLDADTNNAGTNKSI